MLVSYNQITTNVHYCHDSKPIVTCSKWWIDRSVTIWNKYHPILIIFYFWIRKSWIRWALVSVVLDPKGAVSMQLLLLYWEKKTGDQLTRLDGWPFRTGILQLDWSPGGCGEGPTFITYTITGPRKWPVLDIGLTEMLWSLCFNLKAMFSFRWVSARKT